MFIESMIESEIATTNRHMFLYGRNTPQREKTLKTIADKYPFVIGRDEPCVIYIDNIGLPTIKEKAENIDENKISRISMYYLEFTIMGAILNKVKLVTDIPVEFVNSMIDIFSYFSKNKHSNIDELLQGVKLGKEFWSAFYHSYLTTGNDIEFDKKIDSLDIVFAPFMSRFIEEILEVANNKSPFQLVFNRKKEISIYSVQSLNSLLVLRCNGSMNIKIACECDEWETTADSYGNVAEFVHDYTILELDNSFQESMDKIKTANQMNGLDQRRAI